MEACKTVLCTRSEPAQGYYAVGALNGTLTRPLSELFENTENHGLQTNVRVFSIEGAGKSGFTYLHSARKLRIGAVCEDWVRCVMKVLSGARVTCQQGNSIPGYMHVSTTTCAPEVDKAR